MRTPVENITMLQKQINDLQVENQILKNLLERSGIPYRQEIARIREQGQAGEYDPDQGARIIHPKQITDEMANQFYARFWGRQDVYAKRSEKKSTGEAGYYTQCWNFWQAICPKTHGRKMNCKDCPHQAYKQLTKADILAHLQGKSYNGSDVIGVYPLLKNGTCRFLVFDFDNHESGAGKNDFANTGDAWIEEVEAMRTICCLNGIDPLVERSRSGRGAHIWISFDKPVQAALARKFGFALLDKGAEQVNLKSFQYYDRMLPAQDALPEGGLGNLIALPLQGRALRSGNSAFVDSNWNAYPNQWEALWSKLRLSEEFLEMKIKEWDVPDVREAADDGENAEGRQQPWKKERPFRRSDVDGKLKITLADGIYVDSLNLKPAIQNQIRRLAAVRNPVFYKNQAIGMSNFDTSQWIYLGKDHLSGYIEIPRGLYGELTAKADEAGIPYEVSDERQSGRQIHVTFRGELREEQRPALAELARYDNGILQAATAFGKTVVCSALIAEKMHPNEAYEILRHNDVRDEQILADVKACIQAGRTPVILSRYKDHAERLYERVKGYADRVFLMTGNNSKKEHKRIREQMQETSPEETLALVATGSLIGEGFDFPRLDTLIMATPVSFQSVVEQYAGRLNRDYAGKENVIVYDYVDAHIPMFDKMYLKRLKAYRQIGYELCSGLHGEKQEAGSIFDGENYNDVFKRDLLEAERRIVISSQTISGKKVYGLISLLKEKQAAGVEVTVITWAPDDYGYGDVSFWMQLHEDMRQAGFFIREAENTCDNFAVIDEELVWYGNINLLGKEKIDDSIMRVRGKKIAAELMELAVVKDEKF